MGVKLTPWETVRPQWAGRRRIGLRRRALFAVGLFILGMSLLEAGVRMVQRWRSPSVAGGAMDNVGGLYMHHPLLGPIPRPGAVVSTGETEVHVNSLGFRGEDFETGKPGSWMRILCLGGSTTFDPRVTRDDKTWPSQLQGLLRARHGVPRAEVVNGAVSGYSLARTIVDFSLRSLDVQPDWVVCAPGVDDIALPPGVGASFGAVDPSGISPSDAPWWRRILACSALYREMDERLLQSRRRRFGNNLGAPIARSDVLDPDALAAFDRNLQTLVGICRAHGIRLALVTARTAYAPMQPVDEQYRLARDDLMAHPHLSLHGLYLAYHEINQRIRRIAGSYDLILIDQAQELPAGEMHFKDSIHFNDAGSAALAYLAADRLAPALKREQAIAQAVVISQVNSE
jgi:lysophospholipase L1-like esterase